MSGRVVVVGDVMVDVVATASVAFARGTDAAARVALRPGGGGQNVARWLACAGIEVALACRVGADAAGDAAVAGLEAAGVEVHAARDPERATGTCVVVVEPGGERSFLPDRGANAGLLAADVPARLLAGADHVHVSAYGLLDPGPTRDTLRALLGVDGPLAAAARSTTGGTASGAADAGEAARVAGGRPGPRRAGPGVSVDPASAGPLAALGAQRFLGWTRAATLLLPNAGEARVLTGLDDPEAAARTLAGTGREVVVTLGAAGAVWSDGESVVRRPARRAQANDTTGAGDAFTAGLLAARLQGAAPDDALDAAAALAARAVAMVGAAPAQPSPGSPS